MVSRQRKLLAWGVHAYTASGGVLGMFALLEAANGDIRNSFLYLAATLFIDATDGIFARLVRVSEALPSFSGALVDNVVDILTYIYVPIFIMAQQQLLPHPAWIILPVLAALYAYGQVNMKTPDNFFLGFPSYWNVIALYMYWLKPAAPYAVLMIVIPAVLSFLPTRYLYPSRNVIFWKPTWGLGALWMLLMVYLLWQPAPNRGLVLLSTIFPFYYLGLSFYIDLTIRRSQWREKRVRIQDETPLPPMQQ